MVSYFYKQDCYTWLSDQIRRLPDSIDARTPSQWAEDKRYRPPNLTDMPGYYSFDVAPYLREIVDCMGVASPVREVDVMKGLQLGFTVGVLENAVGYYIDVVGNAPMMLITADAELAKLRLETNIVPMINYSGLDELIMSSDENNPRKSGKTDKKIEWRRGGFLLPFGAQNANKLRSMTIRILLEDEVDAWPLKIGQSGDPQKLVEGRTAATETSRKIARVSTPLEERTSRIAKGYSLGDQRKYMVPCKHCGEKQVLEWNKYSPDGVAFGLHFEAEGERVIEESVRYICRYCYGEHRNDDKEFMLSRGEWRPTVKPAHPGRRSYHISALYSPVGMMSWYAICRQWLEAWDVENDRVKDTEKLQVFYNEILGRPYRKLGDGVKLERVRMHRRPQYTSGTVPNSLAEVEAGGPALLLTSAVDVHKKHLDVQVFAWCEGSRGYSIEWLEIEGDDCRDINDQAWQVLRDLIEGRTYLGDDGKRYQITVTLIDTQYAHDTVLAFCSEYSTGVIPISGRKTPTRSAKIKEFSPYDTQLGTVAFHVTVDLYKDRVSAALRREWQGEGKQPERHLNFPGDYSDEFFRQLTVEYKAEKIDDKTGQSLGMVWMRPNNAPNHSWDLTVYNSAALNMVMYDVCVGTYEQEIVDRIQFWQYAKEGHFYEGA
jgi:phage terminase large subunit GpA-like protein